VATQRLILGRMKMGQADEALAPQSERRVRSEPRDRWDDLVLPEREKKVVRSALAELDARRRAISSAGSERANDPEPGLTLLFAGEPGTGKTMAAQLLADELGEGIVRLDLLGVSSQDRGEVENQIGGAFVEAEKCRALLVFDRADSLLDTRSPAKRPRPKRSRERGPALELSKLVERSHGYPGVVVFVSRLTPRLAPSLRVGMDFVVEFPFPWSDARKEIWRRLLPPDARVSDDDLDYLAVSFLDPGATIRDCCVAATAAASQEGAPVQMDHIGRALESEYRKRPLSQRANNALAHLLEVGASGAAAVDGSAAKPVAAPEKPARAEAAPASPKPAAGPPNSAPAPAKPATASPKPLPTPAKAVPAPAAPKAVPAPAARRGRRASRAAVRAISRAVRARWRRWG
jgi:SpoVK/Ycf46/Vps4 family AAA+-type ATPase